MQTRAQNKTPPHPPPPVPQPTFPLHPPPPPPETHPPQVPSSWRTMIEDPATLNLFFDIYGASTPPLSSAALECLVGGGAWGLGFGWLVGWLVKEELERLGAASRMRKLHAATILAPPKRRFPNPNPTPFAGQARQRAPLPLQQRGRALQVPQPPRQRHARRPAGQEGPRRALQLPRVLPPAGAPQDQLPAVGAGRGR